MLEIPFNSRISGRARNTIIIALLYLVLPNLPVWIFRRELALAPHGYVNVECLLLGAFASFLPRTVMFLLLLLEMCASFLYLICYTYQFSLKTLWVSTHYLSMLPVGRVGLALATLFAVCTLAAIVAFGSPRSSGRRNLWGGALLLLLAFLLISIDTFGGHNPVMPRDTSNAIPRVTISPIVQIAKRNLMFRSVEAAANNSRNTPMESASAIGIRFVGDPRPAPSPNVVLVVVESWGLARETKLAEALLTPYREPAIAAKYGVSYGTVPFGGLTVEGEARELCHSEIGFGIMDLSSAEKSDCLPAQFHSRGYQSVAVHGYVGGMFQRDDWYKTIGFDQRWFGPDLEKVGLSHCKGAFPGICDPDIAGWIGKSLLSEATDQPQFIYWVTLNSHLPVSEPETLPSAPDPCSLDSELQNSDSLCSWFRLISRVHQSVQHLALENLNRPTVFILVGDHRPPFADPHLRQLFSDSSVPYVILTPKSWDIPEDSISHGGN